VRFAGLAALSLGGCASVPQAAVPLTGDWGGTHVGLHLDPGGGRLDYDCASGTTGPVVIRRGGSFVAEGMHTPAHGGPMREGEVLPTYPARYFGQIAGKTMSLVVEYVTGEGSPRLGPFVLQRGAEPRIFRCL
jgi:hypothetical protein